MFEGFVNACLNANLDYAKYGMEAKIGDRTNWLLPAIWPRVKQGYVAVVKKPVTAVVGLVVGCEAKAPAPMPEMPKTIEESPLGEGLRKTYEQNCAAVEASAKSTHALMNFDLTTWRAEQAKARHDAALTNVSLPEDAPGAASASGIAGGTLLGSLVANIPPKIKDAAVDKIMGKVKAALS